MSHVNQEEFDQLILNSIDGADPIGTIKSAQRALTMANEDGSVRMIVRAKLAMTCAYSLAGKSDLAFPELAWCLAKVRGEPDIYDLMPMLQGAFSMMLGMSTGLVGLSPEQFEQLFEEFNELSRECGLGVRESHQLRMRLAVLRGDRETFANSKTEFMKTKNESILSCDACVQNSLVEFAFTLADYEEALKLAGPLLDKTMTCGEVPAVTYGWTLRSLVENNDVDTADLFSELGQAQMQRIPRLLDEYAPHVSYLVWRNRWPELSTLVTECLKWRNEVSSYVANLRFLYAVRPMCDHCPESEMDVVLADGSHVTPDEFAAFLDEQIDEYSSALDSHNRNDFASVGMKEPFQFPLS